MEADLRGVAGKVRFADDLRLAFAADCVDVIVDDSRCTLALAEYAALARGLDTATLQELAVQVGEEPLARLLAAGALRRGPAGAARVGASPRPLDVGAVYQQVGAYRIVRRIGAGGFGEVFEAVDTERGECVAVKILREAGPRALSDFKNEVRAVCDLDHPNILVPFEMLAERGMWCFAMELVDGVDFVTHVRSDDGLVWTPAREARLRAALAGLTAAVHVLHAGNLLHLDLKPANVLVRPDGHVAVLDFGLVQRLAAGLPQHRRFAGTLEYMAPERLIGANASPASDWYGVGVMLFQALTGRLPFQPLVMAGGLFRSTLSTAPRASSCCAGVPADLDALCASLLDRSPAVRLAAAQPTAHARGPAAPLFVGRDDELRALHAAWQRSRGGPTCVFVDGLPGIGKSTLVRRFLDELRRQPDQPVILEGRCHERESMPYKGFDTVIDGLRDSLAGMTPAEQAEYVREEDAPALAIFPVLATLVAFSGVKPEPAVDVYERREAAFVAIKRIVTRLARAFGMVLVLDDTQWGDADTVRLLLQILSPPEPAPLLFLSAHRAGEIETSEFHTQWQQRRTLGELESSELRVGPLPAADARRLCATLLDERPRLVPAIVEQAGGNPFLIGWLAHQQATDVAPGPTATLAAGLDDLPGPARRYLEVLAVAGGPIPQRVAAAVADARTHEREVLSALRRRRLIRTGGPRAQNAVETYHDRIREIVATAVAPDRRHDLHLHLGTHLAGEPAANPGVIAWHFHEGGRDELAVVHARTAADEALRALAFDRAAKFYGHALAWGPSDPTRRLELGSLQAEALAHAGRGPEAARAYLAAAEVAPPERAWDLRRAAVEQRLVSGQIEAGVAELRSMARASKLGYPSSLPVALVSTMARLARLRLLRPRPRSLDPDRTRQVLRNIDLASSAFKGLMPVDPARAGYYATKALTLALASNDLARSVVAMAWVGGGVLGPGGPPLSDWGARLLREAQANAERLHDEALDGPLGVTRAATAFWEGEWSDVLDLCDRTMELLRRSKGVTFELNMVRVLATRTLEELGRWSEAYARTCEMHRDAIERGDVYAEVSACLNQGQWHVAQGDLDGAERWADQALQRWALRGCHVQHVYALRTRLYCDLYAGEALRAWSRLEDAWLELRRNMHLQVRASRVDLQLLRGRIALACAERAPAHRARFLAEAKRCADDLRTVRRADAPWHAAQLEAGVAHLAGCPATAHRRLHEAANGYRAASMTVYALCAEACLAAGPTDAIIAALRICGIVEPRTWIRVYAPGFAAGA